MSARLMTTPSNQDQSLTAQATTGSETLLNTLNTSWAGLPFELQRIESSDQPSDPFLAEGECALFVMLDGAAEFVVRNGSRIQQYDVRPGSVDFIAPGCARHVLSVTGAGTAAVLHITSEWFRRLALDGAPEDFGAATPFENDQTVYRLVQTMCNEVANNASTGPLFAESLSMALLSYITRRVPPATDAVRGHLSTAQCQRLRTYIAENLSGELSLYELASLVGLGPRHFSTLFRRAFGVTPHKYVMHQRLAKGARLLTNQRAEISEVAVRVGFCSQSHFTAAFRQAYGVTPRRYLLDALARVATA